MADLREFYDTELAPKLAQLERRRAKAAAWTLAAAAAALAILGALLAAGYGVAALIGVCVGAALVFMVARPAFDTLNTDYKYLVISKLLDSFGSGFTYLPKGGISRDEFNASQLFSTKPNRYSSEDLVTGRIGKTDLKFAEIDAKHESGSGKNRSVKVVFRGIFFTADFHKDFAGATWVVPDFAERTFGSWLGNMLQKANFSRPGQLVKLEDPEFEKLFAVYGFDQVEARYILTPGMMERMVALRKQFNGDLYFAFLHSTVKIAVATRKNLFEAPGRGLKSYLNFDRVCDHYRWLVSLIGIVEALNLNTRIWTKE